MPAQHLPARAAGWARNPRVWRVEPQNCGHDLQHHTCCPPDDCLNVVAWQGLPTLMALDAASGTLLHLGESTAQFQAREHEDTCCPCGPGHHGGHAAELCPSEQPPLSGCRASGSWAAQMAPAATSGATATSMTGSGRMARCMGRAPSSGAAESAMMGSGRKGRRMAWECSLGWTAHPTMGSGSKDANMA